MRDLKKIITFAVVGSALVALLALVTGCQWDNGATVCSGGQCATVSPNSSHHPKTTPTVTHTAMATTTVTATPTIPGATAPAPDPTTDVIICLGQDPSQDRLQALADDQSAVVDLATCLRIPQSQVQVFVVTVQGDAQRHRHDFGSDQGRSSFVQTQVASAAQQYQAGQG